MFKTKEHAELVAKKGVLEGKNLVGAPQSGNLGPVPNPSIASASNARDRPERAPRETLPHLCPRCGKFFVHHSRLIEHIAAHSPPREAQPGVSMPQSVQESPPEGPIRGMPSSSGASRQNILTEALTKLADVMTSLDGQMIDLSENVRVLNDHITNHGRSGMGRAQCVEYKTTERDGWAEYLEQCRLNKLKLEEVRILLEKPDVGEVVHAEAGEKRKRGS